MYLPSIVIVGFYFNKKRALATGLAVCGSGIGTFVFAPLTRYLVLTYGWKGANFIIAGIILNGIAMGAVFRPLMRPSEERKARLKHIKKKRARQVENEPKPSYIIQKIIEEKKRQRTISTGSLDGTIITRDNKLITDSEMLKLLNMKETRLTKVMEVDETAEENGHLNQSQPDMQRSRTNSRNSAKEMFESFRSRSTSPLSALRKQDKAFSKASNGSLPSTPKQQRKLDVSPPRNKRLETLKEMRPRSNTTGSMASQKSSPIASVLEMKSLRSLNARSRTDIIQETQSFTSSLGSIPVGLYVSSNKSVGHADEDGDQTCSNHIDSFLSLIKEMFNISLFKNITFSLLCFASILAMLG